MTLLFMDFLLNLSRIRLTLFNIKKMKMIWMKGAMKKVMFMMLGKSFSKKKKRESIWKLMRMICKRRRKKLLSRNLKWNCFIRFLGMKKMTLIEGKRIFCFFCLFLLKNLLLLTK